MFVAVGTATNVRPFLRQTSVRYSTRCQAESSLFLIDVRAGKRIALLSLMKVARHGNRDMTALDLTSRNSDLRDEIAYGTDCRTDVASEMNMTSDSVSTVTFDSIPLERLGCYILQADAPWLHLKSSSPAGLHASPEWPLSVNCCTCNAFFHH